MILFMDRIGIYQPKLGYYEEVHQPPERLSMHVSLF
jgi:hypothetical protein